MDKQTVRKIASMGGKAAHKKGKAHEFNTAEAKKAGRLGGLSSKRKKAVV